jgi:hypothetical protein
MGTIIGAFRPQQPKAKFDSDYCGNKGAMQRFVNYTIANVFNSQLLLVLKSDLPTYLSEIRSINVLMFGAAHCLYQMLINGHFGNQASLLRKLCAVTRAKFSGDCVARSTRA